MKNVSIVFFLVGIFLLAGCFGPNEPTYFKEIKTASIPGSCVEFKDDVCGLFGCMVDSCWCKDGPGQILLEGQTTITSEEEATTQIDFYLKTRSLATLADGSVKRAVKLNGVFYNVFAEDSNGDELVFTVAADGTIIETVCGV